MKRHLQASDTKRSPHEKEERKRKKKDWVKGKMHHVTGQSLANQTRSLRISASLFTTQLVLDRPCKNVSHYGRDCHYIR